MRIDQQNMTPALFINGEAEEAKIDLETGLSGPHSWSWEIRWKTFSQSGGMSTISNRFPLVLGVGGDLTVKVQAGGKTFTFKHFVWGQNPTRASVSTYLAGKADADGFFDIIWHESKGKHFNPRGEPVVSFDNGYGLSQLTNPVPTYEQAWNWKRNIDAGLELFKKKRAAARKYLGAHGQYTPDQLKRETIARWNGGAYHEWNGTAWVRKTNILCDGKTGNIGWDMNDADNAGKTESELRKRDQKDYRRGHQKLDEWNYFGVCYADAILR